jgi:hypothetical protein
MLQLVADLVELHRSVLLLLQEVVDGVQQAPLQVLALLRNTRGWSSLNRRCRRAKSQQHPHGRWADQA